MEEAIRWMSQHGFDLLSAAGIVSGFLFTSASFRADTRSRRLANLITLTQQHRDLWEETMKNPHLNRVTNPKAELGNKPITHGESQFVVLLILHLHCWFRAIQNSEVRGVEGLSRDMKLFFSLPIPRRVWEEKRAFQDRDFVEFVDKARGLN